MAASLSAASEAEQGGRDWLDRVRALGPMIDAAAAGDEAITELSPGVVTALDEAGIFSLMAPREVGGGEAHPLELIDVIAELSYWDGSAGWYAHAVMTGGSVAGAWLGDEAVAAIFPGGQFLHAAGQAAPTGKAERAGDGYRISGRFSFGSGSPHAQWIVGGYVLHEGGRPVTGAQGQPVMLIGLAPRETVRFLGNWNVLGLRGTGSYDFEVPEQVLHTDFFHDTTAPRNPRGGALYRMGFMALPCISHGGFALGAARRMLDEWLKFVRCKLREGGRPGSEMQTFQRDFAQATAELRAAEAYMKQTFARLFDTAGTGAEISEAMKLDGRLAASHALAVATRIAQAAFTASTTHGLRNGNAIQRYFRDINAGNAHFLTAEQSVIDAGKVLAGVEGAAIVF
jgi:alkylation response protein AidB-like acyl-CoA dehydrogenase